MERLLYDAHTSLRILRRSPGLAISAIIALAMGIGFTTTMFGLVRGGTRPLPFVNAEELVILTRTVQNRGSDHDPAPFDYLIWTERLRSVQGINAFTQSSVNLGGDAQQPERRSAAEVTPGTFDVLQVRPQLGRGLLSGDELPGAEAVAVIGNELWTTRFNADPRILGQTIRVNGTPRTVVGVMPPKFGFPVRSEVWLPLSFDAAATPTRDGSGLRVFGRLAHGVSRDGATTELLSLNSQLSREFPGVYEGLAARVFPFVEMEMAPNTAAILYLMFAIVSLVLVIACANVANLLLARAAQRTREVAVRTALGASRARIIGLHIGESLVLSAIGGVIGLWIATIAVNFFAAMTSDIIEAFWIDFRVDKTVVVFATVAVAVAGVLVGMIPGCRASAINVSEVLKDAAGGSSGLNIGKLSRRLVIIELALATGLLIMTTTITRTAVALRNVDLPFAAREIFTGQLSIPQGTLNTVEERSRVVREVSRHLEAIPGVTSVGLTSVLPGRGAGNWSFSLDTPADTTNANQRTAGLAVVTPGFFAVVGAQPIRGRVIESRDDASSVPIAVVNQSWVRRHSPERDPLGRQVWIGDRAFEIVGIVPDRQMQDPEDKDGSGMYLSMLQTRPFAIRIMAHGIGDPLLLARPIQGALEAIDRDIPVFETATLYDAIYSDKKVLDAFGTLFFAFGLGALFLTVVGLYGVVSFSVARRSREIGVRVAIGATPGDVLRLVLGQGLKMVAVGAGAGLFLAFGISQTLAAVTEVIEPAGPSSYLMIVAALGTTAIVALLRPATHALALQPVEAFRRE